MHEPNRGFRASLVSQPTHQKQPTQPHKRQIWLYLVPIACRLHYRPIKRSVARRFLQARQSVKLGFNRQNHLIDSLNAKRLWFYPNHCCPIAGSSSRRSAQLVVGLLRSCTHKAHLLIQLADIEGDPPLNGTPLAPPMARVSRIAAGCLNSSRFREAADPLTQCACGGSSSHEPFARGSRCRRLRRPKKTTNKTYLRRPAGVAIWLIGCSARDCGSNMGYLSRLRAATCCVLLTLLKQIRVAQIGSVSALCSCYRWALAVFSSSNWLACLNASDLSIWIGRARAPAATMQMARDLSSRLGSRRYPM